MGCGAVEVVVGTLVVVLVIVGSTDGSESGIVGSTDSSESGIVDRFDRSLFDESVEDSKLLDMATTNTMPEIQSTENTDPMIPRTTPAVASPESEVSLSPLFIAFFARLPRTQATILNGKRQVTSPMMPHTSAATGRRSRLRFGGGGGISFTAFFLSSYGGYAVGVGGTVTGQ